jgi:hypothetical protein
MILTELLKWPKNSSFSIRMTKKALKETDEERIKDSTLSGIERMEWLGALKPEHLALPAYINEEFYYDEIISISVILNDQSLANQYAYLLQKAIPYPLVIAFWFNNKLCINLSEKKIHQQQKDKRVVKKEDLIFSDWLEVNSSVERTTQYLNNLSLSNVGGTNLKEYYDNLSANVLDFHRQTQININGLNKEILALKNKYPKEKNITKKTQIHLKIQELVKLKKELENKLKN